MLVTNKSSPVNTPRWIEIARAFTVSEAAWIWAAREILTSEAINFLAALYRTFSTRRLGLLAARRKRQATYDRGHLPQHGPRDSAAVRGKWRVAPIPKDLRIRRVEVTGPMCLGGRIWFSGLDSSIQQEP